MLRAITLDYWDTIYAGASEPERVVRRREALWHLVVAHGSTLTRPAFDDLYTASAAEAHRWWRDEHRGYHTVDRIRWLCAAIPTPTPVSHDAMEAAAAVIDQTLVDVPAPLLPGARDAIARLSTVYRLAVVSDTGFASGRAQDALLAQDGLRSAFTATIYSMDVGFAKPRPEIFRAALDTLGVPREHTLHVGDNERTDVGGALAFGMRAVRLDAVRDAGDSRAEFVARSLGALADYLLNAA
ncbi:MAG: HAD family hydrolase [Gemmatimonadetes bacterium]|nr:HAD family hydrolase [Gemmatimonadota bacterium]